MEEIEEKPPAPVQAVQAEVMEVSYAQQQTLNKMVERCASDLTEVEKERFLQLVLEYADIFAEDSELGRTDKIKHR